MFTGIIESIGTVLSVVPRAGGMMLTVRLGAAAEGTKLGDSIAVNGVCLTVTSLHGGAVWGRDNSPVAMREAVAARETMRSSQRALLRSSCSRR